jgi:ribosomal protein S18 acetylase RimI-like enzyme
MTDAEFEVWKHRSAESFAAGIGPVRGLDLEDALALGYSEQARLLPDGRMTQNNHLWTACANDKPVGSLWISTKLPIPFIVFIEVGEEYRGNGYGRSIVLAGQQECRGRGYSHVDLNVFASNAVAVGLYESLGFTVISQQMRIQL